MKDKRVTNNLFYFLIFFLGIILFVFFIIYQIINSDKDLDKYMFNTKKYLAIRGNILTDDKINIAKSELLYKAIIDTRYLDPDKRDLFVALFSIYSGIGKEKIYKKINSQKRHGKLILSYNISSHIVPRLDQLSNIVNYFDHKHDNKTDTVRIFRPLNPSTSFYSGLDIVESGEKRLFPYENSLTPLIGYVSKYENTNNITRIKGVKGIEKYYEDYLNDFQNGILTGEKDIHRNIIINKNSNFKFPRDGKDLDLNIVLKLQKNIELFLDSSKEQFQAKEIIASVMDSKTGKILSLATSNRFNPQSIKQEEVPYLNVNAVEFQFEPGSVLKPVAMALAFEHGKVKQNEFFNAYNSGRQNKKGFYPKGKYKLGRHTIGDDHNFKKRFITPMDTIIYSSNIGILQIAQRLSAEQFLDGYKSFGFGKKTGIDISYEKRGQLHSLKQYQAYEDEGKDNVFKATDSYGKGMTSTFIQILNAYNVFNNNGIMITPQVAKIHNNQQQKIISESTVKIIKDMLIQTVQKGTGTSTNIKGLEIGGKTGTSMIPRKGKYQREYISSFFGFANDKSNRYTIGVTVIEPSYRYHYASQSATVVFKDIVNILQKLKYLKPSF